MTFYHWSLIIWGGDFNFVWNLDLSKIGGLPKINLKSRAKMLQIMAEARFYRYLEGD